jgi:phosphoribosylformylglycinamidine synthase
VALLDNFSWGDPRRPSTLGELVAAVQGCCAAATAYRAPFVSGKDSLNNEYLGSDGARHAVPPTLVITAIAHHPNADLAVTPDLKQAGDVLVLVGRTETEFGGSHFGLVTGDGGGPVPSPDSNSPARYRALHTLLRTGRVRACHDLSEGGLAVALAEMCIAGRLGADIETLPHDDIVTALFSESTGRFVCEIAPDDVGWFLAGLGEPALVLGTVSGEPVLHVAGFETPLDELCRAFQGGPR